MKGSGGWPASGPWRPRKRARLQAGWFLCPSFSFGWCETVAWRLRATGSRFPAAIPNVDRETPMKHKTRKPCSRRGGPASQCPSLPLPFSPADHGVTELVG